MSCTLMCGNDRQQTATSYGQFVTDGSYDNQPCSDNHKEKFLLTRRLELARKAAATKLATLWSKHVANSMRPVKLYSPGCIVIHLNISTRMLLPRFLQFSCTYEYAISYPLYKSIRLLNWLLSTKYHSKNILCLEMKDARRVLHDHPCSQ
jgi:hypothetical protein